MDDRAMIVFQYAFEQGIALDLDRCEEIAELLHGRQITPEAVAAAAQAGSLVVLV